MRFGSFVFCVAVTALGACGGSQERRPLAEIAPCWQENAPYRAQGQHILPFVEPLSPSGYLSKSVFSAEGFCEPVAGMPARDVLACERDACLKPLEVNTTRERRTAPWPRDEVESCLSDLEKETRQSYDGLNAAFDEPVLLERGDGFTAYRLYLFETGSFAHRMVRWVKSASGTYVIVKHLEATEVPGQGRLSWRWGRLVTDKEWTEFEGLLSRANYWRLPVRLRADVVLFEGKFIELEGVRGNEQHWVISPNAVGELGKLVEFMTRFGDCRKLELTKRPASR